MKSIFWPTLVGFTLGALLTLFFRPFLNGHELKTEILTIRVFQKVALRSDKSMNFMKALSASGDTINFMHLSTKNYDKLQLDSTYKVEVELPLKSNTEGNSSWHELVKIL